MAFRCPNEQKFPSTRKKMSEVVRIKENIRDLSDIVSGRKPQDIMNISLINLHSNKINRMEPGVLSFCINLTRLDLSSNMVCSFVYAHIHINSKTFII